MSIPATPFEVKSDTELRSRVKLLGKLVGPLGFHLGQKRITLVGVNVGQRQKRSGKKRQVTLHEQFASMTDDTDQVLIVHEGIEALAAIDEQLASIVELRFFGGFGNKEIAEILGTPLRSVERGWQFARAWLRQHFEADG